MKSLYIVILSILLTSAAFAQNGENTKHTITRDAGFFSTTYTIDGQITK